MIKSNKQSDRKATRTLDTNDLAQVRGGVEHKHIGGVKYEDITVSTGTSTSTK